MAPKVFIIMGSVRARRLCPQITNWVAQIGRETITAQIEVIDLKDWQLPMDDESGIPALEQYEFEHTRVWSRKISEASAFVFVTPQYNWGYPAPLKNALDHLYKEWNGKPAMIVTYGGHSGDKCSRQLRQVLKGLKMKVIWTAPKFKLTRERIVANTGTIDPATEFAQYQRVVKKAFSRLASKL